MKKLLYTVIAAMPFCGSSLLMTSCDDLFDTKSPSSMDDSNIFSIYDLAEGTIKNIYIYYGEQNYRARYLPWYGYNTDIEWYSSSEQVGDGKADLAVYKVSSNNSQMNLADGKEPWSNIYQGIEKANLAIQGLRTYADLTDKNMAHLYGEALTMRAMAYVDLINAWGDVPARFEPTTTETMYAARTDKDVIYKQLIKDLQEAENMVAWPNEMDATTTVERINKAFVKGLLARVCLQASGYSLRSDGNSSLSSDPELAKSVLYPIALQACKDVMAEEGKYVALKTNFEDIFIDNCRDIIKAGSESLWEIPYTHAQDGVAILAEGLVDSVVCLCAGMGLNICMFRTKELFDTITGKIFNLVNAFTTAVVTLSGVAFCIFVGEMAAHCRHNGGRDEVLRGDKLDVASLSAELEIHGVRHFRVILCDELGAVKKIRVHCDFLLLKKIGQILP